MKNKRLGSILIERQQITASDLERALLKQADEPKGRARRLASLLVDDDVVSEPAALNALTQQLGVPGLDLSRIIIELAALNYVPEEMALAKHVLPVLLQQEQLFLAMADPLDESIVPEIEFLTGRSVVTYVALASALERTTHQAFAAQEGDAKYYFGPGVPMEQRARLEPSRRYTTMTSMPAAVATKHVLEQGPHAQDLEPEWSANTPPVNSSSKNKKKLVLVVEDDDEIRKLLVRLIERAGYQAVEAARGPLALERVKETVPDLIFLDAMLPELHGFEVARRLKASDRYQKIPIVMLSAVHRGWRVAEDAKQRLGVDVYLDKPFRVADINAAMEQLLSRRLGVLAEDHEELQEEAKALVRASALAYHEGNNDQACALLRKAIETEPRSFRPYVHLGLLYARLDRPFDAMIELEKAVDRHPRSFLALKNLAAIYEKAGFRNKAVEAWERSIQAADDERTREHIRHHVVMLLA